MKSSLAYRKNEDAILRGDVPDKYLRILPYVMGERVLEIGAAEGVLALLMGMTEGRKSVTAVERQSHRWESALRLHSEWRKVYRFSTTPVFVHGDISEHLDLLRGVDTVVAVRVVYYFGEQIDAIFTEVAKHVQNVVLCGNRNRAERYRDGIPDDGACNYYASREGMKDLLTRHGYRIVHEVTDGDEIVVGYMD